MNSEKARLISNVIAVDGSFRIAKTVRELLEFGVKSKTIVNWLRDAADIIERMT